MGMYKRTCRQCGVSFEGGPRAWYCPKCRTIRKSQTDAEYRQRKQAGNVRKIGSADICQNCGGKYIVNNGLQKYCAKCAPAIMQEIDRIQGLEYYERKKNIINPARNAARRLEKHCELCGEKIDSSGGRRWCKKCENQAKLELYKEFYEDRNIKRSGNSYIVHVCANGKSHYIKCTTDKQLAYKLRDLAEQKVKDGSFCDWLHNFKKNGRKA